MKKAAAISLLFLLIAPMVSKCLLLIDYLHRYEYYTEVLCENKEIKELQCNGTCHLSKELKAVEDTESNPELPAQLKIEPVLFYQAISYTPLIAFAIPMQHPDLTAMLFPSPYLECDFPPPRV